MTVLLIMLTFGLLLLVAQYIGEARFGGNMLLLTVRFVAYALVAVSCCLMVFINPSLFKDCDGYNLALFVSLFSPRFFEYVVGAVFRNG